MFTFDALDLIKFCDFIVDFTALQKKNCNALNSDAVNQNETFS